MAGEYDAWEHVCGDIFDSKREGVSALLTVYFDGTRNWPRSEDNEPVVHGVSAYIGKQDDWRKFRKEWRGELARKSLDYFHMTDFNYARNRLENGESIPESNPHFGWTAKEMDVFLDRLHKTINRKNRFGKYRLESFTSGLIQAEFDEACPSEIRHNVQCASYYVFNVVQILKQIAHWSENAKEDKDPIHYIFASGDREGRNLARLFEEMWDDRVAYGFFRLSKSYSGMPYTFQDAKDEPALQAADIAAYEMNKAQLVWQANNYQATPQEAFRESLASLGRAPHHGVFYNAERLRLSFQEIVRHQRAQLSSPEAFKRRKKWTISKKN